MVMLPAGGGILLTHLPCIYNEPPSGGFFLFSCSSQQKYIPKNNFSAPLPRLGLAPLGNPGSATAAIFPSENRNLSERSHLHC